MKSENMNILNWKWFIPVSSESSCKSYHALRCKAQKLMKIICVLQRCHPVGNFVRAGTNKDAYGKAPLRDSMIFLCHDFLFYVKYFCIKLFTPCLNAKSRKPSGLNANSGRYKPLLARYIILLAILFFSDSYGSDKERVWIYFTDKGNLSITDISTEAKKQLGRKSIERRLNKNAPIEYDFTDLPINKSYIDILKQEGITIIHKSKWFNGVSAFVKKSDIPKLEEYQFIKKIELVKSYKFDISEESSSFSNYKLTLSDYGPSFNQNNMIGVPAFHSRGYSATGIRIALFDTGFKLTHDALQLTNVIASWDFVENDGDVTGTPGESHGAKVLGVIAGYSPGNLIGPAYNAEYLLAKTDDWVTETHMDEDNWVAAAEWADSLGADIISASVGYNIFDSGEGNYTYEDMDGKTTIVTKAADLAVKKGIVVFTSAGNEGNNSWHYVTAPADGDSVIAIGSVNSTGVISSFSSRGPTYDGRIKPDLVAQGTSTYTISTSNNTGYSSASGTSFSTPLAAGAGALVLSAMPSLTPMQLYGKLITYASNSYSPNNTIGYGIINIAPILGQIENSQNSLIKVSPNPFNDYVKIEILEPIEKKIYIYNSIGQKIKTYTEPGISVNWHGESDENISVVSGFYFVVVKQNNFLHAKKIVFIR